MVQDSLSSVEGGANTIFIADFVFFTLHNITLQTKQNRKQGLLANCFNIFFQVTLLYITLPYKLSKIESKAFWQIVLRYFFKLHYFTLQYITIHYIKLQTHLSK
jgi:hypothetical protein